MKIRKCFLLHFSFQFLIYLVVRSFKQIMIFLFLRALGLEVIERITERKRNKRIAGTDSCDGLQVGCDDLTYIPGRIETSRKESVADNRRFINCWRTARFTYQKASVRPWVVTDGPTKLPSTWIRVYLKTSKELFHMTS